MNRGFDVKGHKLFILQGISVVRKDDNMSNWVVLPQYEIVFAKEI